jgi:hypothetical protein
MLRIVLISLSLTAYLRLTDKYEHKNVCRRLGRNGTKKSLPKTREKWHKNV